MCCADIKTVEILLKIRTDFQNLCAFISWSHFTNRVECVSRASGTFSELISQRRMFFTYSPRESWLCSVTLQVMYIIVLSPWVSIAKFLNLHLVNCWRKKCVTRALWLRNGDVRPGRNSVFEILFSLFRNFKCQFQKQNEVNSKKIKPYCSWCNLGHFEPVIMWFGIVLRFQQDWSCHAAAFKNHRKPFISFYNCSRLRPKICSRDI